MFEAHCVLGFILFLLVFSGHHSQRTINILYPITQTSTILD